MIDKLVKSAITWTVGAYVWDVLVIPAQVAREARAAANTFGGPLLNVGAGTPGSSLRVALFGPTLWGDCNVDIAAPRDVTHGPDRVSYGDALNLPFVDNQFGAVIASHIVEHVEDPHAAVVEMQRVSRGPVYIIVPKWWNPVTWLYDDHRWYISQRGRVYALWPKKQRAITQRTV
jgi:hypothetical protein